MRFKLIRHFALFIGGFAVLSTIIALAKGNDVFAPGGPAAALVAALLMTLPIAFLADFIAHRRKRGTGSVVAPAEMPEATDRH